MRIRKKHLIFAGAVVTVMVIVAAALIASSTGSAAQPKSDSPQQMAEGEEIYQTYCAECHGVTGEGEYPDAPLDPGPDGLMGAPPHDETGHTWHHADAQLIQRIKQGGNFDGFKPMPGFDDTLTDAEIEAVLAYIKTLWTEEQREIQAEVSANQPQSDVPTIRELTDSDE